VLTRITYMYLYLHVCADGTDPAMVKVTSRLVDLGPSDPGSIPTWCVTLHFSLIGVRL